MYAFVRCDEYDPAAKDRGYWECVTIRSSRTPDASGANGAHNVDKVWLHSQSILSTQRVVLISAGRGHGDNSSLPQPPYAIYFAIHPPDSAAGRANAHHTGAEGKGHRLYNCIHIHSHRGVVDFLLRSCRYCVKYKLLYYKIFMIRKLLIEWSQCFI